MDDAPDTTRTLSRLDLERWRHGLARAYPVCGDATLDELLRKLDAVPWPPAGLAPR